MSCSHVPPAMTVVLSPPGSAPKSDKRLPHAERMARRRERRSARVPGFTPVQRTSPKWARRGC